MPKLSIAEQLDVAIKDAAGDAEQGISTTQIAEQFCESHADLLRSFIPIWTVEKVTLLLGKHRAKVRRETQLQTVLLFQHEDALGLKRLPHSLKRKNGKSVPRAESTVGPWRYLLRELKAKRSPALDAAEHVIALFELHSPNDQRITWGEVVEKEAAKKGKR